MEMELETTELEPEILALTGSVSPWEKWEEHALYAPEGGL